MYYPAWKKITILFVCVLGFIAALPNFTTPPEWLPQEKVNLGLDLRGGSHLLLEVDSATWLKEQYEGLEGDLRTALRTEKVGYRKLNAAQQMVSFELRDPEKDAGRVEAIIDAIDGDILTDIRDGSVHLTYGEQVLQRKRQELLEQSIRIVDRRVNETGTKEPLIQRQGDNRILVQVPGLDDPEQLKSVLGKTAKMTFHLVNETITEQQLMSDMAPTGTQILYENETNAKGETMQIPVAVYSRVALSGDLLTNAQPTYSDGRPVVSFAFNTTGARKFAEITRNNVGKRFAVVLDDEVITAPVIRVPIIDGRGQIEGGFTVDGANELAVLLRAGALPAPLKIIEERSVGPSLGADSIASGEMAVVIGFAAIMLFMIMYYGIYGVFANVALLINVILILGVLSYFQATLTLPGIAGIALTMGMAVDANTLIFERIREELAKGKKVVTAVEHGFKTAFDTIMDANITTLIAAFILFYFGSGTVKGFAVTLSIGILASMFSAIMLTRLMMVSYVNKFRPASLRI
jgi:preprotein translocase subunit SecD